jgi:hypothetical protein
MRITWNDFGFDPDTGPINNAPLTWFPPGGQEDIITLSVMLSVGDPNSIEIGLTSQETDDQVRWWKGLRVLSASGNQLGVSETQDNDHAGGIMLFPIASLSGMKLEIWKAKLFGIHTGMYDLPLDPLVNWGGSRFIFHWFKDNGTGNNAR